MKIENGYFNVNKTINLADLSTIDYAKLVGHRPITVTYPAYDDRGMPTKFQFKNASSLIVDDIVDMINSATKKIVILSPYVEDNGLEFISEILKVKLKKNVDVKMIARELTEDTNRRDKLIAWLRSNMSSYPNFSLYNYHYVSQSGHIDSTCHAKVVCVDDRIAYVGSADIRQRAIKLNFEIGTIQTGYIARAISSLLDETVLVSEKYAL